MVECVKTMAKEDDAELKTLLFGENNQALGRPVNVGPESGFIPEFRQPPNIGFFPQEMAAIPYSVIKTSGRLKDHFNTVKVPENMVSSINAEYKAALKGNKDYAQMKAISPLVLEKLIKVFELSTAEFDRIRSQLSAGGQVVFDFLQGEYKEGKSVITYLSDVKEAMEKEDYTVNDPGINRHKVPIVSKTQKTA